MAGTVPDEVGAWVSLLYFDVAFNKLRGTVPASAANWKSLSTFTVNDNAFSGGVLPALPFATMGHTAMWQCILLDSDIGHNAFSCPWPKNATEYCYRGHTSPETLVTDADCTKPPTPPPTLPTPPPTPPPTPAPLPYDCDKTSYTCAPKAGGAFTTKSTCMANCIMPTPPSPPTMYSCNAITGDCFVDAKGTQTQAGCAKACKGTTVPTPRPTAPRGPTPAPAPVKSTAVPLGLGLGLGVPAVAGGLWYRRQRQQVANNHVNHELVTGSGGTAGFYDAL